MEQDNGRKWLYYGNLYDVTFGATHEIYCTVIDPHTVLFLSGWYLDNIRKDPQWLESRRALMRQVRDNTSVSQP